MRGRRPSGPQYVENLSGSAQAKQRLRVVLETLSGTCRVKEACRQLGISEPRFHQLRTEALAAALEGLEPKLPGRKPALAPDQEQLAQLQEQVAAKEIELRAAQARAEIAVVMPHVVQQPPAQGKKNAPAGLASEAPAAWQEKEHVSRLQEHCRSAARPTAQVRRRRSAQRQPRHILEQTLRGNVVEFCQWTQQGGLSLPQTAELLHLSPRTLRHWQQLLQGSLVMPAPLVGRPLELSARPERQVVLDLLKQLGPDTSLAFLREHFPTVARAELEDLLRRYRRVCARRYPPSLNVLQWTTPGAVWAMDFTEAPTAIDGKYPYLFAVRDLASGRQLLWQPVAAENAQQTRFYLAMLFTLHGAPLVVKSDNGSAFRDEGVQALVASAGAILLYSPPRTPRYNGAIEASIGAMKKRTERQAAYLGRVGQWTAEDAAAAQAEANAAPRSGDRRGPSRQELWQARRRLTQEERGLLQQTVARLRPQERFKEGLTQEGPWTAAEERQIDRQAVCHALVEHGYLLFSRRRIPLPITSWKTANIM